MGNAKCSRTGKVRHPNRREAEESLTESITRVMTAEQLNAAPPTRVYQCEHCKGWHLTSRE